MIHRLRPSRRSRHGDGDKALLLEWSRRDEHRLDVERFEGVLNVVGLESRPLAVYHEFFRFLDDEVETILDVCGQDIRRARCKWVERKGLRDFLEVRGCSMLGT